MDLLERELYGTLFNESGDDLDDIEFPEIDEEGSEGSVDDVDKMLATITNGEAPDDTDDDEEDDDMQELEKEYHLASASGAAADTTDEVGDIDALLAECGNPPCAEGCEEEEGEALPVDPQLDRAGDILLQNSATPALLEASLDEAEYEEFIESGDAHVAASEGFVSSGYITEAMEEMYSDDGIFEESGKFAPEGKKWKMTKRARLAQLYATSLQIEARLHKDPDYVRMQKLYAARKQIRNKWKTKYGALAMRRAKKYLKNLMKSNSNGLKKLASRLTGGTKK